MVKINIKDIVKGFFGITFIDIKIVWKR